VQGKERFNCFTQVSGRAGRGELPGKSHFQTYAPEHAGVVAAGKHDFLSFLMRKKYWKEKNLVTHRLKTIIRVVFNR
jgi:hypothetical protein